MDSVEHLDAQQLLNSVPHPYVGIPDDRALEGFQEIVLKSEYILGVFFGVIGVTLCLLWLITRHIAMGERLQLLWLAVSGLVHILVEGSYVLNVSDFFKNTDPDMFMLELWKEYSKADSRYAYGDSTIVAIELCTSAVVGPLCLLAAAGIYCKASWRYAVITVLSMSQFYGTVIYFAASMLEGLPHTRPEPMYLWFYFTFMNAIWLVLPALCTWDSLSKMTAAVRATSAKCKKVE
jgi:cholestenol Delta-isomerase